MRAGKRWLRAAPQRQPQLSIVDAIKRRLETPDPRSPAEFLAEMRAKQAAGQLVNPDTSGWLLDRLEKAIPISQPAAVLHRAAVESVEQDHPTTPDADGGPYATPWTREEELARLEHRKALAARRVDFGMAGAITNRLGDERSLAQPIGTETDGA